MDRPNTTARNYLTPPSDSFWSWTDDGTHVIWVDGQPIATRPEVEAVLARLAPRGLPPFGAVVMMLAACQLGWRESSTGKGTMAGYVKSLVDRRSAPTARGMMGERPGDTARGMMGERPGDTARGMMGERPGDTASQVISPVVNMIGYRIQGVLRGLDAIAGLPGELRERHDSKALLAEILFEQTKIRTSRHAAASVVSELARGIPGRALVHDTGPLAVYDTFLQDIEALKDGLAQITEERVRQRMRTGLDVMVRAAELELPPAERVRRLIAELVTDRELAGLGRLAQRLVAAVHVPRHLVSPEELPLGGISDLSNRGPLERLLISELAHDDLTLAVRVALNEALYLRREAPPRSPPERRCLLLDSGIRMWGVPRVFATAAALALAATADRRASLTVHRARKEAVVPVDPTSREGLVAHLEALEPAPHPGAALAAWVDLLTSTLGHPETLSDLVLVTHEDVIADPAFLACLPALSEADLYAATVNREGQFRLQLITRQGKRPISSARLSLDEVLEPAAALPAQHVALLAPGEDARLPLIMGMRPMPLLFPAMVRPEHAAAGPGKVGVAVTKDGRLLHWHGDGRGARELTAQVPPGKVLDVALTAPGVAEVLVRRQNSGTTTLLRADLDRGAVTRCELAGASAAPLAVRRQGDALLLFSRTRVEAYDPGTGERFASPAMLPPGARWMGTRFFQNQTGWFTATFDGQEVASRHVTGVREGTVALFDREGFDGPWGFTDQGLAYCTATGLELDWKPLCRPPLKVAGISRDGHRVVYHPRDTAETHLLELETSESCRVYGHASFALEPALHQVLRPLGGYNLRRNIKGVAIAADGSLLLQASDGRGLALQLHPNRRLELAATQTVIATARPKPMQLKGIPFTRLPAPRETRYALSEAVFADGSRAFLDGRGLLHLRSADRSLAEVTLVLNDAHVSAWTSSGHVCGLSYFTGDAQRVDAAAVWDELQRIIRRLR